MNSSPVDERRCTLHVTLLSVLMMFLCASAIAQTSPPLTMSPGESPVGSTPKSTAVDGALTEGAKASSLAKASEESWTKKVQDLFGADNISTAPTKLTRFSNVLAALVIGTLGALSFYAGVKFGFISPDTRENVLKFLPDSAAQADFRNRKHFYLLGGVVAGIFQWAQPDVLAPIQAFVLGATWPSVVTRIMAGQTSSGPPPPTVEKIVDADPNQIAASSGKQAKDAVVVIGSQP